MDLSQDIMVRYKTDKKGKKTGQAIPSVMKLAGPMTNSVKDTDSISYQMNLKKIGKTKKIAGYISDQFPIKWEKTFSQYNKQFAPEPFTENVDISEGGVMMEYENIRKDEKGEKTTWVTKKVSEKTF